ncbi:MAG: hypothetical protein CK424_01400 [Legionella sp.]|nr:MAG: hypothetical protein CK424_01400 [Legionella sp.]
MLRQEYYSFLLSQIFGSFAFIVAVIFLARMYHYRKLVLQMQADDPIIPVCGLISLLIGIFLVVTHNVWELKRLVVVTVMCWMVLINAVLWLALPEKMLAMTKKIFSDNGYHWLIVCLLVSGLVFLARSIQLFIVYRSALGMH